MSPPEEIDRDAEFCAELRRRGWADDAQLEEARRLHAAAVELGQPTSLDDVLVRKGWITRERVTVARREVAARLGQTLRIGKYEILQRLGEGGSGIVYRAFQTTLGREVALKVLSHRREGEEDYAERFLREAKVAVTLNHVNIVRGLDFGHADGYHYFAMELVEGRSLNARIKEEGRLAEADALDIGLQMVRALEHAATFQIVHRDVKPENILLTKSGTAKLCDLGLARPVIGNASPADAAGRPMGTALYVAPEQIRRLSTLDFRADVYALGATLYHALTGSPPYTGATVQEILRGHTSAPIPNPRDQVLEISSGAAAVVMKMLAKDPADRYPTLQALDEDLDSVLAGRPPVNTITIGRKAAGLGEGAPRAGEKREATSSKTPAVVAVVVAVAGIGAWALLRGKPEAPPAPPPPPPPAVDPRPAPPGPDAEARRLAAEREAAATAAFQAADAFVKEKGEDSPESLARLLEVAAAHPDTRDGRIAKARADILEKRRAEAAAAQLRDRGAAFEKAFAEARYADALTVWGNLPEALAASGGREAAAAARARVEEVGRRLLEEAREQAAKGAAGDDAAATAAEEGFRRAAAVGIDGIAGDARAAAAALAEARGRNAALRAAAEAAWPRACAEVLAAAIRGGDGAAAILDARAAALAPLGDRVAGLRKFAAEGSTFVEAIRAGFAKAAAAGESVRLRVPSRPGGTVAGKAIAAKGDAFEFQRGPAAESIPAADIHAEDLLPFAWRALGTGGVSDHRGAVAFLLGRGALAAAAGEVKVLEAMGAAPDAAAARALVEAVRADARDRSAAALREAEVLRLQKRLPEARAAYERAVAAGDGYAPALWKFGAFLLETTKDLAEPSRHLEAAAALEPAEAEAWYWIGEARRRGGRLDDALAAFEKHLAVAPADDPRREAVRKALEEVRAGAAAASLKTAREDAARAFRKDDFAASAEGWRRVLRHAPDDAEAMYFLGKSLLALDQRVEGYAFLRKFMAADRKGGARLDDARKVVKDLEQRLGDSTAAQRKAAEASGLVDSGKYVEGLEAFEAAVALAPLRVETYVERARGLQFAWAAEGRADYLREALRDLELALLVNEKHGRAWSLLCVTRFNLEEHQGAVEAGARAIQLDPGYSFAWEYRARACAKTGRFAEAEQAAAEGIRREPRAILHLVRAEALAGLGRPAEARADLEIALSKYQLTPYEKSYRAEVMARILRAEKGAE